MLASRLKAALSLDIVRSGLVANVEADNSTSYPGSGIYWYDLTGNAYHATLLNGAAFESSPIKCMTLNGSTNYIQFGVPPGSALYNTFTYELWCMPSSTHEIDTESTSGYAGLNGQKYLVEPWQGGSYAGAGISLGTNGVSVYEHGNGYMPATLVSSTTISSSVFSHIVIAYSSKQPKAYVNGSLVRTGLTSPRSRVYGRVDFFGYGLYGYWPGKVAMFRLYNKALSDAEVAQNFNAYRSRFGV